MLRVIVILKWNRYLVIAVMCIIQLFMNLRVTILSCIWIQITITKTIIVNLIFKRHHWILICPTRVCLSLIQLRTVLNKIQKKDQINFLLNVMLKSRIWICTIQTTQTIKMSVFLIKLIVILYKMKKLHCILNVILLST